MAMIDRNFDFATNGTVSAAALHNLIDSATIYQDLITGQQPITSVGTNYELLIADGTNPNAAPNAVTVYDLFQDALTAGTYTNANISEALTFGTATGTRLVSTNATITTGTITTAVIPTLTSSTATFGTTTSTAATITSGTITNLASTTGTIATLNSTTGTIGTLNSTTGTIATLNSTTGTITNLSTTLAGDFTISQGTGTLGTSITNKLVPVGSVIAFAVNSAPTGWLNADGSGVDRTTYASLFSTIGTTHGTGNGSTTFNLPDLRGIFVRGSGSQTISGITYNKTFATKEGDAFQGHRHATSVTNGPTIGGSGDVSFGGTGGNFGAASVAVTDPTTDSTNGTPRTASETHPANIALLYCIKF